MTDQPQPHPSPARGQRRRVYRTMLGIALAALLAAWLPFSIFYVNALTNHALVVATKSGPVLRTATSGAAQPPQSAQPAQSAISVTTRSS